MFTAPAQEYVPLKEMQNAPGPVGQTGPGAPISPCQQPGIQLLTTSIGSLQASREFGHQQCQRTPQVPTIITIRKHSLAYTLGSLGKRMDKTPISTTDAPAAIGPYSQAIRSGQYIYTSGQIPLDPASGEMVGEDIQSQTQQVLKNLHALLTSAGSSLDHVIKTTVFLTTMSNFQAMNTVYATYFSGTAPARSTVAVAELPRKALVEIECIALAAD